MKDLTSDHDDANRWHRNFISEPSRLPPALPGPGGSFLLPGSGLGGLDFLPQAVATHVMVEMGR